MVIKTLNILTTIPQVLSYEHILVAWYPFCSCRWCIPGCRSMDRAWLDSHSCSSLCPGWFQTRKFLKKNHFSIKSVDSQSHQPKNVLLIIRANVILLWIIKILLSIALVNDLIGTKKKLLWEQHTIFPETFNFFLKNKYA